MKSYVVCVVKVTSYSLSCREGSVGKIGVSLTWRTGATEMGLSSVLSVGTVGSKVSSADFIEGVGRGGAGDSL